MKLKGTPIATFNHKGVKGRSLTTKESIRIPQIKELHRQAMVYKDLFRSEHVSHADVIKILHNMSVYEFLQQPIDRLKFYRSKGYYNNNNKVK